MNTEQERAEFETFMGKMHPGVSLEIFTTGCYLVSEARHRWEGWAARAALQSHKPEPNDVMLSGVLRMPYRMAMASEISRLQFYRRAQQALNELEALQSQDREDVKRLDWLLRKLPGDAIRYCVGALDDTADAEEFRAAIDHARRAEGDGE